MDSKILLENGTNELEILEFTVDGNAYGIDPTFQILNIISFRFIRLHF